MSTDTAKGTKKVKCDGKSVCVKDSNFKMSTGDEAGSAGGGIRLGVVFVEGAYNILNLKRDPDVALKTNSVEIG